MFDKRAILFFFIFIKQAVYMNMTVEITTQRGQTNYFRNQICFSDIRQPRLFLSETLY